MSESPEARALQSTRPGARALRILILAGLALASCGRGEPEPDAIELEPRIAGELPVERGESSYLKLHVPAGIAPWSVRAQRMETGTLPGFERGAMPDSLLLWGQEAKRVVVPGPFEPARFDQVRLAVLARSTDGVRVELLRGDRTVESSRWIALEDSPEPQRIVARFARNALEREPFDALAIDLPSGPSALASVELVHEPFVDWVLSEGGEPRLCEIEREYRRAYGLGGPVVREVSFRAFEGARLELSYGLAPELRLPRAEPVLALTLTAKGRAARTVELPLENRLDVPARWRSARIPLDDFAGREVELRIELRGGPNVEAFGYVGELRVARDARAPRTVLFVTSDTHRADHLRAAAGSTDVDTPALDALAARGVLFERAQSATNVTLPSHAALFTGLSPRDTRVVDNATPLAEEARTLAEVFRARGWRTFAAVSASHLAPDRSGLGQGFERVSVPGKSLRTAAETLAQLEPWIDDARGEPLFVWLHLFDAHTPYEPPPELAERYLGGALELATDGPELEPLRDDVKLERARYKGEVSYLDAKLGELFALPRFRDAVIAVTADHGECLGQHEVYYDHATLYPDSVRVPLVLAWPGAPAGSRAVVPRTNIAIGRTLLDLAGLAEEAFPGESLLDSLREGASAELLFALAYGGESASVLAGDLLLVLNLEAHRVDKGGRVVERGRHEVELYDLAADPGCVREVSKERVADARRLRGALVNWLASANEAGLAAPPSADPDFRAELAKLGYAGVAPSGGGAWIDLDCDCEECARYR